MSNQFDSANYPTNEPESLVAGDRFAWKRTDVHSVYSNSLYTLSYEFRLEGAGSTNISLTASASGTEYHIEVAAATTAAYTVGTYHWDAYITRDSDSERVRIDFGQMEILSDRAVATSDPRSHNKIALEAIQAVLESRASLDQMKYQIAGRELWRMPIDDLLKFKDYYDRRVEQEIREERRRNGTGTGSVVKVRF